jgi:phosphomannomutase
MINFIFDVDGTLTPSRGKMDEEFSKFFFDFCTLNKVYLVTGSDIQKTREQVGEVIWGMTKRNYQCCGNDVWERGKNVRTSTLKLPDEMWGYLNKAITDSSFPVKNGQHIEERPGLYNLSIPGRNIGNRTRIQYVAYDNYTNERNNIAAKLRERFPLFEFQVAGETGIDITAKGNNKSQILDDFDSSDVIYFFGDKCDKGGNDHEIALAVHDRGGENSTYQVNSWEDTFSYLQAVKNML